MSLGEFRTAIAHFVVRHLHRPHPLVVTAWLWLAAEADELEEKRRCLEAVLEVDPDNTSALLALAALAYLWVGFDLARVVVLYGHAAFPLGLLSWIVGSVLVVLRYKTMK